MRIRSWSRRLAGSCEHVLAVVVVAGALVAGLCAAAPVVGLGSQDQFILYRLAGVSRGAGMAAAGAVAGLAALALAFKVALRTGQCARALIGLVDALGAVVRVATAHRDWRAAAIVAPFALYTWLFHRVVMEGAAFMAPDSSSYLLFTHYRPLGYPLFIRLVGLFSDSGWLIAQVQLAFGLLACVLFAEGAQRVVRNYLVSVPVGIALAMNWQLLIYGAYVLSDYPFFTLVLLNGAAALFLMARPGAIGWIVLLGLSVPVATSIRANGVVLAASLLFLLLLRPSQWRRLLVAGALPMVLGLITLAGSHWAMFGNFSLTRMGGYQNMANTMYVLKPDTPFGHPDFVTQLYERAKPFQVALAEQKTVKDRVYRIVWDTNPMLGEGSRALADYMAAHPDLPERKVGAYYGAWLAGINDWSPFNRALAKGGGTSDATAEWRHRFLAELSAAAHRHNLSAFVDQFSWKVMDSWRDQFVGMFYFPPDMQDELSHYPRLDPLARYWGMSDDQVTYPPVRESMLINRVPLRVLNAGIWWLSQRLPLQALALATAVGAVAGLLWRMVRRRPVPIALAGIAFAGLMTLGNMAAVCLGHVPLPRYLVVTEGYALVLPLAVVVWFCECGYPALRRCVRTLRMSL